MPTDALLPLGGCIRTKYKKSPAQVSLRFLLTTKWRLISSVAAEEPIVDAKLRLGILAVLDPTLRSVWVCLASSLHATTAPRPLLGVGEVVLIALLLRRDVGG